MASKQPTKKAIKEAISSIPVDEMDGILNQLDQARIEDLISRINGKKEEISKKEYAVSITAEAFGKLKNFMENEAEWSQTESLGVIEVAKVLESIQKEGINGGTVFIQALPLEAMHYFLSKSRGKGLQAANDFLAIWKPLDLALQRTKSDASEIKDLEKELAAAQQGISIA